MRKRDLILCALSVLFVACADDVEVPRRVALWEVFGERVAADNRPVEAIGTTIFRDEFNSLTARWLPVQDPASPLAAIDGLFGSALGADSDGTYLELSGEMGAMYTIIDVDPESYLDVSARVRMSSFVPKTPGQFSGATLFVGELKRGGPPAAVFADGVDSVLVRRSTLELVGRNGRWESTSQQFQAGPETHALLVLCILGLDEDLVASGTVEFDDVTVRQLEESDYQRALAEGLGGTSAGLAKRHGASLIRGTVGADSRPSLIVFPDQPLTLELQLPAGDPVLEFSVARWPEVRGEDGVGNASYSYDINSTSLGRSKMNSGGGGTGPGYDDGWHEQSRSLAEFSQRNLSVTFRAIGRPIMIGAPMVRDKSERVAGPNLVLISIDTLRADHVGAYGYEGGTTPHLDALAEQGQFFADMTAQAPFTLPSQTSMFSGQVPSVHGVTGPDRRISTARTPMLAEALFQAGIKTQAFTSGGYVDASFGFDRGFQSYTNVDPWRYAGSPHGVEMVRRNPDKLSAELLLEFNPERIESWVEDNVDERFFMFVHTYTVHDFDPPPGFLDDRERIDPMPYMHHEYVLKNGITPEIIADILDYYDAALRYVDGLVGALIAKLEALGIADNTIVVVTSDHGKEIGERGLIVHGTTLYEELVAVPLMMRVPGMKAVRDERSVMSIDIAPTLLALMGLPVDSRMQGVDLFDAREDISDRPVWSEVDQLPLARKFALRTSAGSKLIHGPPVDDLIFPSARAWELYDLPSDPDELQDRSLSDATLKAEMRAKLLEARTGFEELGSSLGELGSGEMSAETRARLEQLGYL